MSNIFVECDGSMSKMSDTDSSIADIEAVVSKLSVDFRSAFQQLAQQRATYEADQAVTRSAMQTLLSVLCPDNPLVAQLGGAANPNAGSAPTAPPDQANHLQADDPGGSKDTAGRGS
jgi:hypothetical protein